MSTRVNEDGIEITDRGRMNRRYRKDRLTVVLSPKPNPVTHAPILVRRWDQGKKTNFDLFLTMEEAEDLADMLDDILDVAEQDES